MVLLKIYLLIRELRTPNPEREAVYVRDYHTTGPAASQLFLEKDNKTCSYRSCDVAESDTN